MNKLKFIMFLTHLIFFREGGGGVSQSQLCKHIQITIHKSHFTLIFHSDNKPYLHPFYLVFEALSMPPGRLQRRLSVFHTRTRSMRQISPTPSENWWHLEEYRTRKRTCFLHIDRLCSLNHSLVVPRNIVALIKL